MKNHIIKILTTFFVFLLLLFLIITNLNKPRIFIVHSYALDYSWVRDINKGIMRVMKSKPYSIKWHYMDTKRHPSEEYKKQVGDVAKGLIKQWNPDIIIAIDDNAQKYVASSFLNHPGMSILFSGVNADSKVYGYDWGKNVTGILERIPFKEFREVFAQMLPSKKRRIVHISDASTTSQLIHQELSKVKWEPFTLVKSYQCKTFEQWKSAVFEANKIGDVLLVTHYHTIKDKAGKTVKPKNVILWTENHLTIPDIGCWGFFVEDGGMMAVAVSPYEQGEEVAKMAVNIIENKKSPEYIPIKTNNQYVVYVRGNSVKKRGLTLPKILEAFAKATNHYY